MNLVFISRVSPAVLRWAACVLESSRNGQCFSTSAVMLRNRNKKRKEIQRKLAHPPSIPYPSMHEASFNPLDDRNDSQSSRSYFGTRTFDYRTGKEFSAGSSGANDESPVEKESERVTSSGTISKAAEKIKPDDSRDEDDGSLELKEELSPGSANKEELAKHLRKRHGDKVPAEVMDKLDPETVELIKNQSGKSATGAGG